MTCRCSLSLRICSIWIVSCGPVAGSPAIWSDLTQSFSKAAFADPALPENQDRITNHVALTRGNMAGLYNALVESSYDRHSPTAPADTEWATDINNPSQDIAAANWAALDFTTWAEAYGSQVGMTIVDRDAVAHLITDDVYIDFRVTSWASGQSGGAFSYLRAAPPAPTGDYNGDHVVDAADYTVWRDTLGQTVAKGSGADGNADGTINSSDYSFWVE